MSDPGKDNPSSLSNITPRIFSLEDVNLQELILEHDSLGYQVYPGAERVDYDFTAERLNMFNTNLIEASAHLIKGCVGAGILTVHVGYMYGGLWTSLGATFVIGAIVCHCMLMLVKSAQKVYIKLRIPRLSYPELAEVAVATAPWKPFRRLSKTFRYILDTFLFIKLCGTCCIYEIMIANTVKKAIETVSSTVKEMNLSDRYYILIITLPLIMLCSIRNIKYLAPFSLGADIFIVLCVFTTMYFSISKAGSIQDRATWKSLHGLLRFNGICLFSIDGVSITLAVENNMRKPKYFSIVLQFGMTVVLVYLSLTGFLGYWSLGDECRAPITVHLPQDIFPLILQFLMAIMLCVIFAVNLWVPFKIVWRYIGRWHKSRREVWERIYRLVYVSLITCMAVAFPNTIKIMLLLGNFFVVYISFIFPPFIESLITWPEPHKGIRWSLLKNCFLMLFGVILSGAAFYSVIEV